MAVKFAAISVALSALALPQAASAYFDSLWFDPTTGRVGYHMDSRIRANENDVPGGLASCGAGVDLPVITSGSLPPGLEMVATNPPDIGGTPRQPGDWMVTIVLNDVRCVQGPDQAQYGPRTLTVKFHIDP